MNPGRTTFVTAGVLLVAPYVYGAEEAHQLESPSGEFRFEIALDDGDAI